jgi:dihydroneopterin aldolase/2-amino-4-hydroxy-6-hydroxymethyldihydropteridine diphosphokinase
MSNCRVGISGISAQGRHGANPGEQDFAQEFTVDLEVTVDVEDDVIEATADYSALADEVRRVVAEESHILLETLADSVARAVFEFQNVVQVVATVHKPGAAQSLGVDDIWAEAIVS